MNKIDFQIAWRNVWRNPRRTFFTCLAIIFGCTLMIFSTSMQYGVFDRVINNTVNKRTSHVQVLDKEYEDKQDMLLNIDEPAKLAQIFESTQHVLEYTFRSSAFALVSSDDRTYGINITGIKPEKEKKIFNISETVRKGDFLDENDYDQAVLGETLAENLKVSIGDEIVILGQGLDGSVAATIVTVKGLVSSGMEDADRNTLYITYDFFDETFFMQGTAHRGIVLGNDLKNSELIRDEINRKLQEAQIDEALTAKTWSELIPGLLQAIALDLSVSSFLYLVLSVVIVFSIMNTFIMVVFERTREFGTLLAIGAGRNRIRKVLFLESVIINCLGVGIGMLIGSSVVYYFSVKGIPIEGAEEVMANFGLEPVLYPRLSVVTILGMPGFIWTMSLISAWLPTRKLKKITITKALQGI